MSKDVEMRKIKGMVKYTMKRLNVKVLEKLNKKILSHNEALKVLNMRNGNNGSNIYIASNYPWLYSPKDKVENIEDEKILVIPSPKYLTQSSHNDFYKLIMMDKRAEFNELSELLKRKENLYGKRKTKVDFMQLTQEYKERLNKLMQENKVDSTQEYISVQDELFQKIPNPKRFKSLDFFLTTKINGNVKYISQTIKKIKMFGNVTLADRMQGRNSIIRKCMVKKTDGLRAQILLQARLLPNQVILPLTWQFDIGEFATDLVDVSSIEPIPSKCWIKLKDKRLCMKRDPVINLNSESFYDEIAFADSSCIYIGQGELENKHADFDGDTQAVFILTNRETIAEIDAKMIPQSSSRSYYQMRYHFQEHFILAMHKRKIPDSFPYKKIYNDVREFETNKWKENESNKIMLNKLYEVAPHIDFNSFIEPTNVILKNFLVVISNIYGAKITYDVYSFLIHELNQIANNKDSSFKDEDLENVYLMKTDVLCDGIIKSCFSGAKGTLMDLYSMITSLMQIDQTTKITPNTCLMNETLFFNDVESSIAKVARASKSVTKTGHDFFLANIGYESISFANNKLCILGKETGCSLNFFHPLLLIDNHTANVLYSSIK